jgi:hypothetical protein
MLSLAHLCELKTEADKAARRNLARYTHLLPTPNVYDMLPSHTFFGPRPRGKEEEQQQQPEQPIFDYGQPRQEQAQQGEQDDVYNDMYPTKGPLGALPRATQDPSAPWTLPRDYYPHRDKNV